MLLLKRMVYKTVWQFKNTLLNIYHLVTNIKYTAKQNYNSCMDEIYLTHIFSTKQICYLAPRNTDNTSTLKLWAI